MRKNIYFPILRSAFPLGIALGLFLSMAVKDVRSLFARAGGVIAAAIAEPGPPDAAMTLHDSAPEIDRELAFFTGSGRDWMQQGLLRSTGYLPLIGEIFAKQGVPAEMACIAFVESGFDNKATSPVWAHGMWQFMPETARAFGLRVDGFVDERQDFWRASEAAAKYLAALHKEFGDWLLAAAAYNAGQNYLRGRLEATGATTFWELSRKDALYAETKAYVPRILAAMRIFRNPIFYGFHLEGAAEPFAVCRGKVRMSTLAEAARAYGVSVERLIELNPHLENGWIPDTGAGYELTLPRQSDYRQQSDKPELS